MNDEGDLAEVLDNLDMESYLDDQGVEYRHTHGSRGPQLNLKTCPTCGGDKWKVFIGAENGLGNCFSGSCEAKFNKFTFIRAHTGLTNGKTVAHIFQVGEAMGWRPPRKSSAAVNIAPKIITLPKSTPLPHMGKNMAYLANRGITKSVVEYMHLRYCAHGQHSYMKEEGVTYQDFSKRIIIPIFDLDGELISFQGRDITGVAEKKYLFPSGLASCATTLYNAHNARHTKRVIVGEGVFDVAALKLAMDGESQLRDVVPIGTFGKHLSHGQANSQLAKFAELKARGIEEVTMCWDGETQATDDAITAGFLLKGIGLNVRIAMLPQGKDPNEVVADVVRDAFWKATTLDRTSALKLKMQRRA